MSIASDWCAENLFGHKRLWCQGTFGGATMSAGGFGSSWFMCEWCGKIVDDKAKNGPCPKCPFPPFTLRNLLRKLAALGHMIVLRTDTARPQKTFTLIGKEGRIADTDDPFEVLCDWAMNNIIIPEAGIETCPTCGTALGVE